MIPLDRRVLPRDHPGVPTKASHPLLKRVGHRIRKARQARKLSQEALAHTANLDRSYVSGLERGEFNISLVALYRLARALDVPLATLVGD